MRRSYNDAHVGTENKQDCGDMYGNFACYPLASTYTPTYTANGNSVTVKGYSRGYSRSLGDQAGVQFAAAVLAFVMAVVGGGLAGVSMSFLAKKVKHVQPAEAPSARQIHPTREEALTHGPTEEIV